MATVRIEYTVTTSQRSGGIQRPTLYAPAGSQATIKSLQRHIEETETREVEHKRLKQNFK